MNRSEIVDASMRDTLNDIARQPHEYRAVVEVALPDWGPDLATGWPLIVEALQTGDDNLVDTLMTGLPSLDWYFVCGRHYLQQHPEIVAAWKAAGDG